MTNSVKPAGTTGGKLASLDGIRGVSFLIVFVAHAGLDQIVPGRFGVNIFFLLSGYLITTLLIRERQKTGWISLKMFYTRRALRIFPPMYSIFGITVLYLWLMHQMAGITLGGVCAQLFYYQNYWFHNGIVPGLGLLWSLAVEEHFYLLFPPLMLLFLNRFKMNYLEITVALLWICGGVLVWRCCVVAFMPQGMRWARDASDTRADSILFGCALACLEQTPLCRRLFERRRLERYILPGCVLLLLCSLLIRNDIFRETLRYTLQAIGIAPFLYYFVTYPDTLGGRFLNTRWMARLGVLSYSLYLIHETVVLETNRLVHFHLLAGVLSFLIALALANAVHFAIEQPTDRLRKRWRHTNLPAPASPSQVFLSDVRMTGVKGTK